MRLTLEHLLSVAIALLVTCVAAAQPRRPTARDQPAGPQIARLWSFLGGEWNTVEEMEHTDLFPNGGERRGILQFRLGQDGRTLIGEGTSSGSAGQLDYLTVIWWNANTQAYGFFICFNGGRSPCQERGTARWERGTLVNDYTATYQGRPTKMRDTWLDITPTSYRLVFAIDTGGGSMKTMITTRNTRRGARSGRDR